MNEKSTTKGTVANLATSSEIFSAIAGQKYKPVSNEVMSNKVIELCIVEWLVSTNEYQ